MVHGSFRGDFNISRFPSEKRNSTRRSLAMEDFSNFIEDMSMMDPQLEVGTFTWFKGDDHRIASRIDRILISEEWVDKFRNMHQILLQRLGSYHFPVSLP